MAEEEYVTQIMAGIQGGGGGGGGGGAMQQELGEIFEEEQRSKGSFGISSETSFAWRRET